MRMIGHLPSEGSATRFSDFLYVQGISNVVEQEKDGWAVWVHSEDELEQARDFLTNFLGNPNDPRFQKAARQAREQRTQGETQEVEREKRFFDRGKVFRSTIPYGVGPLTIFLMVTSITVSVVNWFVTDGSIEGALKISQFRSGLLEVRNGEVWRLLTPIFLHANPLVNPVNLFHLLFNMLWLFDLGSMIEGRKNTRTLLLLVLVTGVVSNLAQFYQSGPEFYGMSGVAYALLGYIWMKGKYDPNSGLYLHPQTIMMMLIWFVLCFTPMIRNVANTVHAVGLAMGVMWGLISSLRATRS